MKVRQALILSVLTVLLPAAARAVPHVNGTTIKVSNCDTCKKFVPAVAGVPTGTTAGTFLVAWESSTPKDPQGISDRWFLKTGLPKAPDVAVTQDALPMQHNPSVAADALGNYVMVWEVAPGSGLNSDIMAQRFKATGAANGPAFKVNVDDPSIPVVVDAEPAVAVAADGSFVVSWILFVPPSTGSAGSPPVVMARRYTKTGTPVGAQVQVSTGLTAGTRPSVCIDTTGRAVVVWTNIDEIRPFEPSLMGVSMRRLSTTGALLAPEFLIAQPLANTSSAAVACGTGGTFVVAWSTDQLPAVDRVDIVAQRYTTAGNRNGKIFRVNSTTPGDQTEPAIMTDASGNFVITWQSRVYTSSFGTSVVGRRFLASATADGADFVVSAQASLLDDRPLHPRVANLGAAGFVIAWVRGNVNVQAQRYKLTP